MHHTFSGQTSSSATRCHQGGIRPGWLLHRAVGSDLCRGPSFPGPQTHLKGQQEHCGAQGKIALLILTLS